MPEFRKANTGDKLRIPASDWNAAMDAAMFVRRQKHGAGQQPFAGTRLYHGQLTALVRDGANWRWTYDFEEVYKATAGFGGWVVKPNGLTGQCFNKTEDQNGATGLMGNGVDVDNLPEGFELQPCPIGTPVTLELVILLGGAAEFQFSYPNGVDGMCPLAGS